MNDVPFDVPLGVPFDVPIEVHEHRRFPQVDGAAERGRTPRPGRPRRPSRRDLLIVRSVERFDQVSSLQLQRLFFANVEPEWRGRSCSRALARLVEWETIGCIERALGGGGGGSTGYIYIPKTSKAVSPNPHTLAIAEIHVRLIEEQRKGRCEVLAFEPERFAHDRIGGIDLKPDAWLRVRPTGQRRLRWFLEIDLGKEWKGRLNQKMRAYVAAYQRWPDQATLWKFPRVLFIVPDHQRVRYVEEVVQRQERPNLFKVCRFEEAIPLLLTV
jgi:hypothetical protein